MSAAALRPFARVAPTGGRRRAGAAGPAVGDVQQVDPSS
jgi:hypothetical protein